MVISPNHGSRQLPLQKFKKKKIDDKQEKYQG